MPPENKTNVKQGVVEVVSPKYYKSQTHYAIFEAVNHLNKDKTTRVVFTVKGRFFVAPKKGDVFRVTGVMRRDNDRDCDYFDVRNSEMCLEEQSADGMIKYLEKEGPNLGVVRATQLVNAFGGRVVDALANKPEEVEAKRKEGMFPGLTDERLKQLVDWAKNESKISQVKQKLYSLNIGPSTVNRIIAFFGKHVIEILDKNPFRLQEIDGIGWATADKIAAANGCDPKNPLRIRNGIMFVLSEWESDGHSCIRYRNLMEKCQNLLNIPSQFIAEEAAKLFESEELCTRSVQPQRYSSKPELFDIVE